MAFDPSKPFKAVGETSGSTPVTDSASVKKSSGGFDPSKPFKTASTASQVQEPQESGTTKFLKGAVDEISTAGAAVGGMIGGSAAGAASMGMGAIPGAFTGAVFGGATGQAIENVIKHTFWPEEAPQDMQAEAMSIISTIPESATMEVGGQVASKVIGAVAKPVINAAAKGLDEMTLWLGSKTIPAAKQLAAKLGPEGVQDLAQLMKDEAVTTVPGTLRKVGQRVDRVVEKTGEALGGMYKEIDKTASSQFTGKQVEENLITYYKDFIQSQGKEVSERNIAMLKRKLRDLGIKPDVKVTHEKLWRTARTLEGEMYNAANPEAKTLSKQMGTSLRQLNGDMAEAVAPEALVADLQMVSGNFRKLKTAQKAINAKLTGDANVLMDGAHVVKETGRLVAATTALGKIGLAVIGGAKAASSTLAKTTAASLTNLGAELVKKAPQLGGFGKQLTKLAAAKGYEAVAKRHAYLMQDSPTYRKRFMELTFQDEQQQQAQQMQQPSGPQNSQGMAQAGTRPPGFPQNGPGQPPPPEPQAPPTQQQSRYVPDFWKLGIAEPLGIKRNDK